MVGFFPTVYPEETLYSILSRYHSLSFNDSTYTTLMELFGNGNIKVNHWLQGNLNHLVNHLPVLCTLTAEEIIEKHSLLPVFKPFLPKEKTSNVKKAMLNHESISAISVLQALGVGLRLYDYSLRYCTDCIEKDKREFGEAYWHRVHQISGVVICPMHGVLLRQYFPPIKNQNIDLVHLDLISSNIEVDKTKEISPDITKKLHAIAKDLQWLLTFNSSQESYDFFYKKYRTLLNSKGLSTPKGNLKRIDSFFNAFVKYYGEETLELLGCVKLPEIPDRYHWIIMIISKSKYHYPPVYHVLMSRFLLDGSIKDLFKETELHPLFGNGPWMCLNSIAPHYKERCITRVKTNYSIRTMKPIGKFTCDKCGFSYSISGIPTTIEEEEKIHRVIDFGWLWRDELNRLINEKYSLSEICKKLNQSLYIIKRKAELMGLTPNWKSYYKVEKKPYYRDESSFEEIKNIKRNEWIIAVGNNPTKNRNQMKQLSPELGQLVTWFYNNDKEWFKENSPKVFSNINSRKGPKFDWHARDLKLLEQVKQLVENWNDNNKPIRITLQSVIKRLNISYLGYHNKKFLPLTMEYLDNKVETTEDFQMRRVRWTINFLKNNNDKVSMSKVLKHAGIDSSKMSGEFKEKIRILIYGD
jgi:hypothetical protein